MAAGVDEQRMAGRRRRVGPFLLGVGVAALGAAALFALLRVLPFDRTRIDVSRPSVLREIQNLRRLETVVFAMDKIVTGERGNRYLPMFLAGDRLLLIAYGEVTAGVDLGAVAPGDIVVNGSSVRLTLPGPVVFSARIDNQRTRVYSRETGLLSPVDPNLETEVRREAERQIRQAALDGGVLRVAADNARSTLSSFLRALGFSTVDVRIAGSTDRPRS